MVETVPTTGYNASNIYKTVFEAPKARRDVQNADLVACDAAITGRSVTYVM